MSVTYYHIKDLDMLGKEEDYIPYLYKPGNGWEADREHILTDRLMGYDGMEPEKSSYRTGNSEVMGLVMEISREAAERFIKQT